MYHTMYADTEVMGYPALLKLQVEELFYYNKETSGKLMRDYILQNVEEKSVSKRNRFSRPIDDEQIKSADTVTYDDNGNVIPLSERFNAGNKDIRHSARKKGGSVDITYKSGYTYSMSIDDYNNYGWVQAKMSLERRSI